MVDTKSLKKLADTCRKAGITSFKCSDFEFTLSAELPEHPKSKQAQTVKEPALFPSDAPTQEELLYWSAGAVIDKDEATPQ